ncbi:transposase [Leptospirillum ferrooxidans]|uniref:Putative transposase n=1 Tax=Leptospirillum ferrooxidans (strain C2-3) TaxID=1162668 RepID=I0IPL9_LEPFC|nr:transposase [Leptospirillum ferrooxidans]BAM07218.1 putative transposase [Leptospirillum ferrooxidans C2-3]
MKKILKAKLTPTKEQAKSLLETIETFKEACNWISRKSFEAGTPYQMKLHHLVYFEAKEMFPALTSQMIVRAIAKVSGSYRTEKKTLHSFKKHSAMEYDKRLLSFKSLSHASMATVHGRITVPLIFGHYAPLDRNKMLGQADLTTSGGKFFLNLVIDVPDGTPYDPEECLGIDMGIVNLSTDSDGESFSGERVDQVREKIHTLKKVSGKEARLKKDTNHCLSKRIVSKAKGAGRGIALEDLKGFNGRTMVGKSQKERFGKWT